MKVLSPHKNVFAFAGRDKNQLLAVPQYRRSMARVNGRMPTERELYPARPLRTSPWRPKPAPAGYRRSDAAITTIEPEEAIAEIIAAPDLGQMRVNFRYCNVFITEADYSEKAGRTQYFEGDHESAFNRWFNIGAIFTDVQFQPITMLIETPSGKQVQYTLDGGVSLYTGAIVVFEIKPSPHYFLDPIVKAKADIAEAVLAKKGVGFQRLYGSDFKPIVLRTIKDIYDNRKVSFDQERDVASVYDMILKQGGRAPLIDLIETLDGSFNVAEDQIQAMISARILAVDLSMPLTRDTAVSLAPEDEDEGALRRFLKGFVAEDEG
jgi:hypothetical protein